MLTTLPSGTNWFASFGSPRLRFAASGVKRERGEPTPL
jgi:hypothetical protein